MVAARLYYSPTLRREAPGDPDVCRTPAAAASREKWGCDRDRDQPWTEVACQACTDATQDDCTQCGGTGCYAARRCQCHYMTPRNRFVCQTLSMLDAGVPPWSEDRGWSSWPKAFVDALLIASGERETARRYEDERRPKS